MPRCGHWDPPAVCGICWKQSWPETSPPTPFNSEKMLRTHSSGCWCNRLSGTLDCDHKTHRVNRQSKIPYLNDQIPWSALLQQSKETASPERAWCSSVPIMASATSHCQRGGCGDSGLFLGHPLHLRNGKWRNQNLWPSLKSHGKPWKGTSHPNSLGKPRTCVGIFRGMKQLPHVSPRTHSKDEHIACMVPWGPHMQGESPEGLICRVPWGTHMDPRVSSNTISFHGILLLFPPYTAFIYNVYFSQKFGKIMFYFFMKDSLIYKQTTGSRVRKTGDWAHFCKNWEYLHGTKHYFF